MNKQAILAIAKKDIRAISANVQVWLPMLIIPAIMGVLLPGGIIGAIALFGTGFDNDMQQIAGWVDKMPAGSLTAYLAGLPTLDHKVAFLAANYMLAPFFLLIPLMTASVIAADSFAGEKERGTLETILFAPVDLLSLFLGKILSAFVPAVGLSLGTFVLCGITVNLAGWSLFHGLFFPHVNWLPLMLLVIPMISLAAILFNVFISARVATFQAAYQMGGMVVLPFLLLLAGQATGVLMMDTVVALIIGLVLAALNAALLQMLLRKLNRNLLFESQVR
ncbi:MAG TPA: ABC transporter permease subunit [Symbiobacteriaceae bacterium]|nr:ABC transporter permease subunit [Symbiobacteriaceae bacterium]